MRLTKIRAQIAEKISPAPFGGLIGRFVAVRFFAPSLTMIEIYDKNSPTDMAAWRENQMLYPCQIIAQAAEREILMGPSFKEIK